VALKACNLVTTTVTGETLKATAKEKDDPGKWNLQWEG
jgi:hypothetical protein